MGNEAVRHGSLESRELPALHQRPRAVAGAGRIQGARSVRLARVDNGRGTPVYAGGGGGRQCRAGGSAAVAASPSTSPAAADGPDAVQAATWLRRRAIGAFDEPTPASPVEPLGAALLIVPAGLGGAILGWRRRASRGGGRAR